MSYTAVTKPDQGDATLKSLVDALIDNDAYLYGVVGASSALANGSFENDNDIDGIPDNWTRTLYTGGAFALDTSDHQHGAKSVRFTHPGGVGNGGGYIQNDDAFPVSPNRPVRVLWEMKSSGTGINNRVELYWFKADLTASTTPSTSLYASSSPPTSWTGMAGLATPPSDARFAKVRLTGGHNGTDPGSSTTTRFDNVQVIFDESVPAMEVLTASGNWTCPVGVHYVEAECWGGGGSGGSHSSGNSGSGGGGEYATGRYAVTPGTSYAYTIGAGGAAVSGAGATGNNGGNTSFGSFVSANGGSGGQTGGSGGASGAGGTGGTGGTLTITGQNGGSSTIGTGVGGDSPRGGCGGVGNVAGAVPGGGGGSATTNGAAGGNGRIVLRY
jgi:hypothetical protein